MDNLPTISKFLGNVLRPPASAVGVNDMAKFMGYEDAEAMMIQMFSAWLSNELPEEIARVQERI